MAQASLAIFQATASSSPGGSRIDRDEAMALSDQLDELERATQELRKAVEAACR